MNQVVVTRTKEIGALLREARKKQAGMTQAEFATLANVGNRFVVDAENGKETIQAQKLLELLALAGLEVVIRRKGGA
ncbi:MAG: helix-turn-helix domain-containing protein [Gallionellaceae bacterium]|jgi:y4mF family transcriptional regulator|nr:helix-turn-helix domain-containing protein [Gallionellaceae bacterium]